MNYICIGKIVNTHGLKGELKIQSYSDFDRERYKKGNTVYIQFEGNYVEAVCAGCRVAKGFTFVTFEDMKDINLVEKYKTCEVYIPAESRKTLKKGEYYRSDLTGLTAVGDNGTVIGTVTAVEETNSRQNHIRIRREDESEVLVPWIPAFILNVDLEAGTVTVRVIEGLL